MCEENEKFHKEIETIKMNQTNAVKFHRELQWQTQSRKRKINDHEDYPDRGKRRKERKRVQKAFSTFWRYHQKKQYTHYGSPKRSRERQWERKLI